MPAIYPGNAPSSKHSYRKYRTESPGMLSLLSAPKRRRVSEPGKRVPTTRGSPGSRIRNLRNAQRAVNEEKHRRLNLNGFLPIRVLNPENVQCPRTRGSRSRLRSPRPAVLTGPRGPLIARISLRPVPPLASATTTLKGQFLRPSVTTGIIVALIGNIDTGNKSLSPVPC